MDTEDLPLLRAATPGDVPAVAGFVLVAGVGSRSGPNCYVKDVRAG